LATYGKPRFLGIVSLSDEIFELVRKERLIVIVSHRGEEFAEIVGPVDEAQEKEYRMLRAISEHGEGPIRGGDPVVTDLEFSRIPTEDDMADHESQMRSEEDILRSAQELVVWHQLPIKLIDAETLLDEKKLFFYFTSDQRVDFRSLVKDLARKFKTRIELRQMGVRDEARIIRGLSSCGLPCCCSYWLNQFAPIGIKMVKEQNIALNPAKISGICGRLMCCMSFEHKVYKDLWAGLPGPGSKIKSPSGNYIVISMDISREAVRCHKPSGGDIAVPIGLFDEFRQAVINGGEWEVPADALPEPVTRRKPVCAACRGNLFERASLEDARGASDARSDGGASAVGLPGAESRQAGAPPVQGMSERKRVTKRRGRRGAVRPQEGSASAPRPQEQVQARPPERPRRPVAQKFQVQGQAAPQAEPRAGEKSEAERPKRARRRRRRTKRPGGDDSAA
jgi:cell fate regulator YaaT (PSP1 superfamily)